MHLLPARKTLPIDRAEHKRARIFVLGSEASDSVLGRTRKNLRQNNCTSLYMRQKLYS
jgi:hypothetical protein